MPQRRKYTNHAARQAAYVQRKKRRATPIPKTLKSLLRQLRELREEITRRRAALRCPRRQRLTLPGPSGWELSSLMVKLIQLLNFIEAELDRAGIRDEVRSMRPR